MPEDKVTAIRELASGQTVAMVGDGVNDALRWEAIRLGRLAERVIQQNIVFAERSFSFWLSQQVVGRRSGWPSQQTWEPHSWSLQWPVSSQESVK